jgi:hypothetical protein
MTVFLLPRLNLPGADIERLIANMGARLKLDDPTYCEGARRVMRFDPAKATLSDGGEDSEIVVSPALGFRPEDIPEYYLFGNGWAHMSIVLKDGKQVECTAIVVDRADASKLRARIHELEGRS